MHRYCFSSLKKKSKPRLGRVEEDSLIDVLVKHNKSNNLVHAITDIHLRYGHFFESGFWNFVAKKKLKWLFKKLLQHSIFKMIFKEIGKVSWFLFCVCFYGLRSFMSVYFSAEQKWKKWGKENGIENCFFERVSWKVGKVDQKKGFHFFKVGGIGAKKFG